MPLDLPRRSLLAGLGAAASPLFLPRSLARQTGGDDPFALGVAAGEPWPDGFVLWTRLAPEPLAADGLGGLSAPATVRWEVFADEGLRRFVAAGDVQADARLAYSVHVEVSGLQPGRPYWYRFTALGAQSPVGRAKTAPVAVVEPMRLAVASCAHYEAGWFSAYRHMAAEAADLVLFLGDYIYEYSYRPTRTDLVRRHDITGDAMALADYRRRYALYKSDADLKALHQSAACLVTWDDHEVQNDYAAELSAYPDPQAGFAARRRDAYQAFYEHMPLRRRSIPRDGALRLYDRHRFGDLVEIAMLDGRQYKSAHACPRGGLKSGHVAAVSCPDFQDPARSFLGREQEDWLYDGFRKSGARWNIIAQQTLFSAYRQRTPEGEMGEFTEGWGVQGQSRRRLVDALSGSQVANPVFLGGDMHCFIASDVHADPDAPGRPIAAEFVTTSVTSDKMPDSFGQTLGENPHIKVFDNGARGYLTAVLRPDRMETQFRAISDRTDPEASVRAAKAFVVESGRPGVTLV